MNLLNLNPDERQKALIQAADGDLEQVKALLSVGTDANGMPLIMAIQCDQPEIVQAMIDSGVDVNLEFANTTPLIRAINRSHPAIVEMLIKAGADIHKNATNGDMPLQVALKLKDTKQEQTAIIQMLETSGIRP